MASSSFDAIQESVFVKNCFFRYVPMPGFEIGMVLVSALYNFLETHLIVDFLGCRLLFLKRLEEAHHVRILCR
jgi:hypothetical protein